MNVSSILKYEKDPTEDYYAILGCDPSSTAEQISTEFKLRAKEFHPDKCSDVEANQSQEKFKQLLEVKLHPRLLGRGRFKPCLSPVANLIKPLRS